MGLVLRKGFGFEFRVAGFWFENWWQLAVWLAGTSCGGGLMVMGLRFGSDGLRFGSGVLVDFVHFVVWVSG